MAISSSLRSLTHPWPLFFSGLVLTAAAFLLSCFESVPGFAFVPLLFLGTLLGGIAIQQRLRQEDWTWPHRSGAAALVLLFGLLAFVGGRTMRADWLSGHMFYGFLIILSLAGALLILVPPLPRKVLLSLFVLFHFTGMATCVTSIDPPGSMGLFLSKQLFSFVYRPYLSFLYMTNAYHFYSPEPGHPELFWFAVCYDDDSYTWVKLPERANSPINMHYQRMLAVPAHSYGAMSRLPLSSAEIAKLDKDKRPARGSWELIQLRRQTGSTYEYRRQEEPKFLPIPVVADVDISQQYREPHEVSKMTLASVAQRVFHTAPPPRDEQGNIKPGVKVKSVKMYRVVHLVLSPQELAAGVSPLDKTKHWPYFMGEFDGDGNLIDDKDPFLYWYLPIAVVPESYFAQRGTPQINVRFTPRVGEGFLLDCLEMHAAGPRRVREENK